MKEVLFFIIFVFFAHMPDAFAQKITFKGRIIDDLNEEAIPFTSVALKGTTKGTSADLDGNYMFTAERVADSLVVTSVGYKRQARYVGTDLEQTFFFRLIRETVLMEEIVVVAGENPADRIIRKIVANKDKHDINQLDNYKYETYNKLEIDIFQITPEFRNRRLFKPFQFIFDNVDSLSEEKPFLPMFLTETLSDYYYSKSDGKKEVIKASRVSGGAKDESITQFLGTMYQKLNIYDNFMVVMGKNVPSPITNNSFANYKYYLLDSTTINGLWSYKIRFKPRFKQQNAFVGELWVADSIWAIQRVSMELQAGEANINFVNRLSVYEEFSPVVDQVWALTKDKLIVDFISGKDKPGLIGRKSTYYKKFETDLPDVEKVLADKENIAIAEDAFDKKEDFWAAARHDSLSVNEKKVYAMIDTLNEMPIVKTYIDIVNTIMSGYKSIGKFDIGPYSKLLSYNQVDGWRLRFGGRTNYKMSERIRPEAYIAYGLRSHEIHYGAKALFMLSRKPRQTLEISYKDDKDIESSSEEEFGQDNFLSGIYRNQKIPQKLIHEKKANLSYARDWKYGISSKVTFERTQHDPYFDFWYFRQGFEAIPPDTTVLSNEVKLNLRMAYQEKFVSGKFSRTSLGTKYPIVNLNYTFGLGDAMGSNLPTYHKLEINATDRFFIGNLGYTRWILTAGKIWGDLPFFLLENFPGNETYFYNNYSFNRLDHYEFTADTYATLFLTHYFDGFFFNHIPLLRKLKLRELISARLAAGSISEGNIRASTDSDSTLYQFQSMGDKYAPLDKWTPRAPDWTNPYLEVSVGIENIVKLFRVDAIWRVTHRELDRHKKVGIRVGMQLKF